MQTKAWFLGLLLALPLGLANCSESGSGAPATGGSAGSGTGGSGTGGSAGAGTGGTGATGGASGSAGQTGSGGSAGTAGGGGFAACGLSDDPASTLVVNEVSTTGDDWVELYNTGSNPVDISGMVLADLDSTNNCPKLTEALTFPAGTSIGAGEYLLIVADQPGAPMTPQTDCLMGPPSCFHVGFGISGSNGDAIFLLNGTSLVAQADVPANAAGTVESWCRFPDGTGTFAVCQPTPGAGNALP